MTFKVTNSYSRDNLNYESGSVKNIYYGDIHTKFQTLFDLEKENVPYINEDISLNRILKGIYFKIQIKRKTVIIETLTHKSLIINHKKAPIQLEHYLIHINHFISSASFPAPTLPAAAA